LEITENSKKLSCRRGKARCTVAVEILSTVVQLYENYHLKRKTRKRRIILKVIGCHRNCGYSIGHVSLHISRLAAVTTSVSGTVSEILSHLQCM